TGRSRRVTISGTRRARPRSARFEPVALMAEVAPRVPAFTGETILPAGGIRPAPSPRQTGPAVGEVSGRVPAELGHVAEVAPRPTVRKQLAQEQVDGVDVIAPPAPRSGPTGLLAERRPAPTRRGRAGHRPPRRPNPRGRRV